MNLFGYIKEHLSILDVVREYTQLKRAGNYWKGSCPIHSEKTPSFTVIPEKGIYYCFGCSTGGDVITFISSMENCSKFEAAQHLIERYGLEIPKELLNSGDKSKSSASQKKRYFATCKFISDWLHNQLIRTTAPLSYLYQRNVSKESIKGFSIGYLPSGLSAVERLIKAAADERIMVKDLIDSKFLFEGNRVTYSPFENRIIFPIRDHLGRVCGFGGRVFRKDDNRVKYYNTSENEFFDKGSMLFGLDLAKKEAQRENQILLVEGYTDCIAMAQAGAKNTVATLGTACTPKHIKMLSHYSERAIAVYDSDSAGKKATMRLMELCLEANIDLKVIRLPEGEDPASFLSTRGTVADILELSTDAFDFLLEAEGKEFADKTLAEKLRTARKILKIINDIADPIKKELLTQKASKSIGLTADSIEKLLHEKPNEIATQKTNLENNRSNKLPPETPNNQLSVLSEISFLEKKLFCAIVDGVYETAKVGDDFLIGCFHDQLRGPLVELQKRRSVDHSYGIDSLLSELEDDSRNLVSRILTEQNTSAENQDTEQLLRQFGKEYWKRVLAAKKAKLKNANADGNRESERSILAEISKLKSELSKRGLV